MRWDETLYWFTRPDVGADLSCGINTCHSWCFNPSPLLVFQSLFCMLWLPMPSWIGMPHSWMYSTAELDLGRLFQPRLMAKQWRWVLESLFSGTSSGYCNSMIWIPNLHTCPPIYWHRVGLYQTTWTISLEHVNKKCSASLMLVRSVAIRKRISNPL